MYYVLCATNFKVSFRPSMKGNFNPLRLFSSQKDEKDSDNGIDDEIESPCGGESGEETGLRRVLGVWDGLCLLVGIMIGSGIFASPGLALERCGSPGMSIVAWCCAGLLVGTSSFSYMELAAMMPSAGGDFSFIRRAYGDDMAFVFAWYNFWVSKTGSQAIIATIFGQYLAWLVGGGEIGAQSTLSTIFAVIIILTLMVVNCMGIRESSNLQNVLTCMKFLLLGYVFVAGMIYAGGDSSTLHSNFSSENAFHSTKSSGFFTGMVAALWAFDGWADLNFIAEEIIDPTRNIPRVMAGGIFLVTIAYVAANLSYLAVLKESVVRGADAIAIDFGYEVGGAQGGTLLAGFLAFGVAVATVGSANGSIMTGGRAFFAVARGGMAPRSIAQLNAGGAPWAALVAQGAWTCVLLLLPGSSFSALLDYFGPVSWAFYALTSTCVIRLRSTEPDTLRPFKVPLYPLPPIITAAVACCILVASLMSEPLFTMLAICFVALGVPVRWTWLWWQERSGYSPDANGEQPWQRLDSNTVDSACVVTDHVDVEVSFNQDDP